MVGTRGFEPPTPDTPCSLENRYGSRYGARMGDITIIMI